MKKIIFLGLLLVIVSSCGSPKKEAGKKPVSKNNDQIMIVPMGKSFTYFILKNDSSSSDTTKH